MYSNAVQYSIRTADWRYTEWVAWDGVALRPTWSALNATELYAHTPSGERDVNDFGGRLLPVPCPNTLHCSGGLSHFCADLARKVKQYNSIPAMQSFIQSQKETNKHTKLKKFDNKKKQIDSSKAGFVSLVSVRRSWVNFFDSEKKKEGDLENGGGKSAIKNLGKVRPQKHTPGPRPTTAAHSRRDPRKKIVFCGERVLTT